MLNYYGVNISQEQIVARTYGMNAYGQLPDWPSRLETITTNLNNWSIDNTGRTYVVRATLNWGAPTPAILGRTAGGYLFADAVKFDPNVLRW